ncbi:uncharacterized protein LOC134749285, partial [Cydia strobilella]|uniref:uncharacterized protein LOC134749285 n=1 Tax=Cydia strobilella TaxID=1100964 RepID=UPI0030061A28
CHISVSEYKIIPNRRRGRPLIMINGFTFSKKSKNVYRCSKYNTTRCPASVYLNADLIVTGLSEDHNHQPPKYVSSSSWRYPGFVPRLINDDFLLPITADFAQSIDAEFPQTNSDFPPYKMITTQSGTSLVMVEDYTFSKHKYNSYRCSKYTSSRCRASVRFDNLGNIKSYHGEHNHEPPTYVTSHGKYLKINS